MTISKITSLTLAHINDTHSYFEASSLPLTFYAQQWFKPFVSAGGFARIATRVQQLKTDALRQQRGFLFVHAGDCFQGTLYFSLFKGQANAQMLNLLGIDAMTLGNHELDMGNELVAQFAQQIQFPLLAGNWDLSQEESTKPYRLADNPKVKSYDVSLGCAQWVTHWVQDEPIALFGLSLDKMAEIAQPDPDTPFVDAFTTAKHTIECIQAQGINKIILISHLGYEADKELAAKVSGISLIVGGHTHVLQGDFSDLGLAKADDYGQRINDTYVVQAGYHSLALGHCHIDFDETGRVTSFQGRNELLLGRRLFLDAAMNQIGLDDAHQIACDWVSQHPNVVVCKKDPVVQHFLQTHYLPQVRALQQQVIGYAPSALRHVRIPDAQGASEIAPWVAKSFYLAMQKRGYPVQFAIHNAGGVRASLTAGQITLADVAGKLLPFELPVGIYRITGKQLALTLEGAINNALNNGVEGTGSGSYPYTSQLSFRYHTVRPLGQRISQLCLLVDGHWQAVEPDRFYLGTSSAYTMKGKEGYDALIERTEEELTSVSMADAFIECLTSFPDFLHTSLIPQSQFLLVDERRG